MDIPLRNIGEQVTCFITQLIQLIVACNNQGHAIRGVMRFVETDQFITNFTVVTVAQRIQITGREIGKSELWVHRHFLC